MKNAKGVVVLIVIFLITSVVFYPAETGTSASRLFTGLSELWSLALWPILQLVWELVEANPRLILVAIAIAILMQLAGLTLRDTLELLAILYSVLISCVSFLMGISLAALDWVIGMWERREDRLGPPR